MNQFFEPVKANNLDGVYTGYDKIVRAVQEAAKKMQEA